MTAYMLGADRVARTACAPTLAGWYCTVTWEGASFLWKAAKSLEPNGSTGSSQKSGENQGHRVGQEREFARHDVRTCLTGVGI